MATARAPAVLAVIAAAACVCALGCSDFAAPRADASERIGGRSEAEWRANALVYERDVEALMAEVEALDAQLWALPASFDPSVARREASLRSQMARLERQLEAAEDRQAEFEDRARRLEVPPGWLH